MPYAYVLLVHRSPEQVLRLIDRLVGERSWVFLHVDASAPASVFDPIAERLSSLEHVALLPRNPVRWSGWGTVEAIHTGFRAALAAPQRFSHVIVCSGQDYPIHSRDSIAAFLHEHQGCSFISYMELPCHHFGPRGGLDRLQRWYRPVRGRRVFVPLVRRHYPPQLQPVGGSSWVCLSRAAVTYLLEFTRTHPRIVRYHHHIWAPDEHYVQSVVVSGDHGEPVFNENLWHIEWKPPMPKHPDLLTMEAFPRLREAAIRSSDAGGPSRAKLWARKFDLGAQGEILDRIDDELLGDAAQS